VFPEHIEILPQLVMGGVSFDNFHQVDKQGLVLDRKQAFDSYHDDRILSNTFCYSIFA
jgi:hypothetical protein